jgi:dTDP-4-dehydrorhamnose reductase
VKVLLIGGSGQLGQSLQKIEWDTEVELISPSSKELDVTVSSEVSKYIAKLHPSFVINASAWTNVPSAEIEYEKALKINSEAVRNIAISCDEIKSGLVHVSTDYVFDGTKGAPYTELDLCNPLNAYGRSKYAGEQGIASTGLQDYFIIRTSWLYSKYGKNFVKTITRKALAGAEVSINDDQFGSPTFAGDLASALAALISEPPNPGIYNFSNTGVVSWFGLGQEIYRNLGSDVNLVSPKETEEADIKRPAYSPLDTNKWQSANLNLVTPWQESLKREIASIVAAIEEEDM